MENTPLQTLFMSEIGLLSLFTIGFMIVMAAYLFYFVRRNVRQETAAQREREARH
ncbi:DUF3149 domain-containing protein [Chitiniphilus purpureus]|uniref:DUF3149 domain-containing protein n=1 Tax=Chitiniphilus purpureus TaxID=2981137 RepID=A0ABY6DRM0_9NEIS|nr:DUF3149 domain-containing protein [Chitiniphilus sp. CD1]UXY17025.1 DUF3149 domain-containing protein [Chitiniphilus sp. CD1]